MPRPNLPKPEHLAEIARALKAEGISSARVQGAPDGSYVIAWGESDTADTPKTALQRWQEQQSG